MILWFSGCGPGPQTLYGGGTFEISTLEVDGTARDAQIDGLSAERLAAVADDESVPATWVGAYLVFDPDPWIGFTRAASEGIRTSLGLHPDGGPAEDLWLSRVGQRAEGRLPLEDFDVILRGSWSGDLVGESSGVIESDGVAWDPSSSRAYTATWSFDEGVRHGPRR